MEDISYEIEDIIITFGVNGKTIVSFSTTPFRIILQHNFF
jgi:hypothetical protein